MKIIDQSAGVLIAAIFIIKMYLEVQG